MNKLAIDRDIAELLHIHRLAYFGHVSRMQPERYPHVLLHGHISLAVDFKEDPGKSD